MEDFTNFEYAYLAFAIFGCVSFVLVMIMQFVGMGDGVDTDGSGAEFDSGDTDLGSDTDSDASFKLLSFQGLVSFSMMFGLVGLASSRSLWGEAVSLILATAAGVFTVFVVKQIFSFANKMQSSGTMNMDSVVGKTGSVYTRIPENGIGKVIVTTGHSRIELNAKTVDGKELGTGEPVLVTKLLDNSIVLVEKR